MNKINLKTVFIFILTLSLLYLLYYSKYLYEIVPPIIANKRVFLFGDWTAIYSAIKCNNLGINVYIENPCDPLKRIHVYGYIFLLLPTITKLKLFFYLFFPVIVIGVFILLIIYFYKINDLKSYLLYFLAIFNPSSLLLFERLNFDLIIIIGLFLLVLFKNNILKLLTITFLFSMKFWAAIFISIFIFINNYKLKKNLIYILVAFALFFILVAFEFNNIKLIFLNANIIATKYFIFGINSLDILYENNNNFLGNYFLIITYAIFLISILISIKIGNKALDFNLSKIDEKEFKLLIISSLTLIMMFFIFDNVHYREIFILGCIPFFLKYKEIKINKIIIYFLILRYFVFIMARIIFKEFGIDWLYYLKYLLDIILVSNLLIIIYYFCKNYYKYLLKTSSNFGKL